MNNVGQVNPEDCRKDSGLQGRDIQVVKPYKCGRRGPAGRLTNVWNGHPAGPCPGRGDAFGGMGSDSDGTKGSRRAATHAGPITRAVDAISCRSLERGGPVSRGSAMGLLSAAGITQTPTVGSSRGGLLESACAVVPWLAWVPALAERLGGKHRAKGWAIRGSGHLCSLKKRLGSESCLRWRRGLLELCQSSNSLNCEWVERPFLWRDIVPSTTCLLLGSFCPAQCVAFSERRLFWAHKRRSFASVQRRFETRPPWWFMYDTTDLLPERISTWCLLKSGRKNWQVWHTANISRQLMCRPDSSSDQRLKVSLPSHSAPQPLLEVSVLTTFLLCAVSRITPRFSQKGSLQQARADTQARVTITRWQSSDAKLRMEPSALARTGWVSCEADPTKVPAKPLP